MSSPPSIAQKKALKRVEKNAAVKRNKTTLSPDFLMRGELTAPTKLESISQLREEMTRVYRLVYQGKLVLTEATRLVYLLDRIIVAMKTEHEIEQAQKAYAKAWSGVVIIGKPQGEEFIDHAPTPPETQIPVFSPIDGDGSANG